MRRAALGTGDNKSYFMCNSIRCPLIKQILPHGQRRQYIVLACLGRRTTYYSSIFLGLGSRNKPFLHESFFSLAMQINTHPEFTHKKMAASVDAAIKL